MNPLVSFFNTILYQPLLNLLILIYLYFPGHDFGLAVILLTLIIRVILHPFSKKAIVSQRALTLLQPKIKEIQQKYKSDKTQQTKAIMQLYKQEKISPMSGCLPILLQLPILIALYRVFLRGFTPETLGGSLYSFVPNPGQFTPTFLGILNLAKPNLPLAILAGALQFVQSKLSTKIQRDGKKADKKDLSSMMQKQMLYFLPLLTVFLVWRFGAIIGLYWVVSTAFAIGEHYLVKLKTQKSKLPERVASRRHGAGKDTSQN